MVNKNNEQYVFVCDIIATYLVVIFVSRGHSVLYTGNS